MSLALAGQAPATFEIKSAHLSLVALLLKSPDLNHLAAELEQRFGDMPGFFEGDATLIDLQALPPDTTDIDFSALQAILRRHQLQPLAVRGGPQALMTQAVAAGLVAAPDAVVARIARGEAAVIAEVKKASPSAGVR